MSPKYSPYLPLGQPFLDSLSLRFDVFPEIPSFLYAFCGFEQKEGQNQAISSAIRPNPAHILPTFYVCHVWGKNIF